MRQGFFTITENERIAQGVWRMRLAGDASTISRPGQFVDSRLDGKFLRRPISVCDWDDESITIIYKLLGSGTEQMSAYPAGKTLDVLTGLGNGFDAVLCGRDPLVVGGGVGLPPLYGLTKALLADGKRPTVVMGFNSASEIFLLDEFRALGVETVVATVDGSCGLRGFVTDALPERDERYVFSCGPLAMLRAVYKKSANPTGQYSLEERMGCGFGACMGCTIPTRFGPKRVCRDGPVFLKEELLWDD